MTQVVDVKILAGAKEVSGVLIESRTYVRAVDLLDACGFDYIWSVEGSVGKIATIRRPTTKLSEYFSLSEFACPCCGRVKVSEKFVELVARLHELRKVLGKPIKITSAYRCSDHNEEVGGAAQSQHLLGAAADIIVSGVKPSEVAEQAERVGFRGIGVYSTFTHVDVREKPAKWRG